MRKIFCDICGKETESAHERNLTICNGGFIANKKIDICVRCNDELDKRTAKVEREYMKENGIDIDAVIEKEFAHMYVRRIEEN